MINGRKINAIAISFPTTCINLPRRIPFQPMNYKDALNVTINDKLTKAKLIDIAHALQDRCLLNELDKPELISLNSYIKDVQSRMDIHHHEMRELNKDVTNVINYIKDKYNLMSTLTDAK